MKNMADSSNTTSPAQIEETATASGSQGTRVSIFGIIIVGLLLGLIVGLVTSPAYTVQGFFLGFAGGALIAVAAYFFATERDQPAK